MIAATVQLGDSSKILTSPILCMTAPPIEPFVARHSVTDTTAQGPPVTLELCAGSAGLTRALSDCKFVAHGVDHKKNRHNPKAACAKVDLATPDGQRIIWDFVSVSVVFFTWMGPPCGTASRAREIPLTAKQRKAGAPTPRPLRDARHPLGIPSLSGADLEKVKLANAIYSFCNDYIDMCLSKEWYFAIENPRGSWLWSIPRFAKLLQHKGVYIVDFQACAFGGERPKWTRIVTNCPELQSLRRVCPGESAKHVHAAWGAEQSDSGQWSFRTAQEAEYS